MQHSMPLALRTAKDNAKKMLQDKELSECIDYTIERLGYCVDISTCPFPLSEATREEVAQMFAYTVSTQSMAVMMLMMPLLRAVREIRRDLAGSVDTGSAEGDIDSLLKKSEVITKINHANTILAMGFDQICTLVFPNSDVAAGWLTGEMAEYDEPMDALRTMKAVVDRSTAVEASEDNPVANINEMLQDIINSCEQAIADGSARSNDISKN